MLLAAGLGLIAAPVAAQQAAPPVPVVSQPVVQALPATEGQALNAALARLGRDPRDVNALIDAGNAALSLGDVDAAVGFFAKADQLQPNSPRVRAGLAAALVRSGNPYDAIPLFTEAEAAGGMDMRLAAERGLAYDLVGDNANAQRYYREALAAAPNDETTRRLAMSQAISGDRAGMETTLAPLLQRQDKSAWRIRAFGLAILGRSEEAVQIAYQTMPGELAAGIAPYLRYMPRLTRAQQASAALFGHFPRASEIGVDDPRVARFAPPVRVASADSALVPKGDPLGGKSRGRKDKPGRDAKPSGETPRLASAAPTASGTARTALPDLKVSREQVEAPALLTTAAPPPAAKPKPVATVAAAKPPVAPPKEFPPMPSLPDRTGSTPTPLPPPPVVRPALAAATPVTATPPPVVTPPAATVATPPPAAAIAAAPAAPATTTGLGIGTSPSQSFDLAKVTPPSASAPAATPPPQPAVSAAPVLAAAPPPPVPAAPAAARPRSFSEVFGDLDKPAREIAPASGAVDIRKIAPVRPAAKPDVPAKPAHPSRIWVQVGTGRDKAALSFTWRGIQRETPELFRSRAPSITDWGRTNRLLVGPFESEAAANAFMVRMKREKVDGFLWTSPAGQVVDPLN